MNLDKRNRTVHRKRHRSFRAFTALLLLLSLLLCSCARPGPISPSGTPSRSLPSPSPVPIQSPSPVPTIPPMAEPTPSAAAETPSPSVSAREDAIPFPAGPRYHYRMDLTLDPNARTVSGHIVFSFFNDSREDWDTLCMRDYPSLFTDAGALGYTQEEDAEGALTALSGFTDARDNSTLPFSRDEDPSVLWIPLSRPLAPGEEMTVEYDFSATIPKIPDRFGVSNGIFCVANFYPILAEYEDGAWSHAPYFLDGECFYSEIADYDVNLTVPAGFTPAATGTRIQKTDNGTTATYTYSAPCVRDFVFAASSAFRQEEAVFDGVRVVLSYVPEGLSESYLPTYLNGILECAGDSLAAFGEAFGGYPYTELDIVLCRLNAGGMEYPNLIFISDNYLLHPPVIDMDSQAGPDAPLLPSGGMEELKICVAHEIGHQWFMGIVGSNSGMHPWMDESLTCYTEIVYTEYIRDPEQMDRAARNYGRGSLDLSDPAVAANLRARGLFPINRSCYESPEYVTSIYSLGRRLFFQMEEAVGRKEFHNILREYVQRNAFRNASPSDFFEVLFALAGTDNADLNALVRAAFDL